MIKEKTLNEIQSKAKNEILKYCNELKRASPFLLTGAGGTGKTFVVCEAINDLKYIKGIPTERILFLSMSHKANDVLKQNLILNGIHSEVKTLHNFFGWVKERDANNNEVIKFLSTSKVEEKVFNYDLIIIDEISLIDNIFTDIIKTNLVGKVNIILTGDSYQLPPIQTDDDETERIEGFRINFNGRRISNIFNLRFYNQIELKINVRAENEAIKYLCERVRERIDVSTNASGARFNWHINEVRSLIEDVKNKKIKGHEKIIFNFDNENLKGEDLKRFYDVGEDGVSSVYLGGTNRYILQTNFQNRLKLSNKKFFDLKKIEAGEKILITKTIKSKSKDEDRVFASSFKTIKTAEEGEEKISFFDNEYTLKGFFLELEENEGDSYFYIDKSAGDWKKLQSLKYRIKNAKTKTAKEKKQFYNDLENYVNSCIFFTHSYAITIHRAQGSTYKNVNINIDSINSINAVDFWQSFYVAISRAKKVLLINTDVGIIGTNYDRSFSLSERGYICAENGSKCYVSGRAINDFNFEVEHIFPRVLLFYYFHLIKTRRPKAIQAQKIKNEFAQLVGTYYEEIEIDLKANTEIKAINPDFKIPNLTRNENGEIESPNFIYINKLHDKINLFPILPKIHLIKTEIEGKKIDKYKKIIDSLFLY